MSINLKDNVIQEQLSRPYEISLWTLQDGFIAVLGDSSSQYQGYIQDPVMQLSNDGTQELDFTLPMYINNGITKTKSNIWAHMTDAVTIAGMRKIKVVFNKGTDDEAIYEFVITKVTDTHEQNQPKCEIHCEGLAFHELGKIGYKISLSRDNYYADNEAVWDEMTESNIDEQLDAVDQPNIDYWNKKIGLTQLPSDAADINSAVWYYRVIMDQSGYSHGYARDPHIIYEEAYVSSYDDDLNPLTYTSHQEKLRFVEAESSNIYNLTQDIAKTFGVYCRYDYEHDENLHITARIVTYYNNFIDEKNRLEFTYPYTTKRITRENDCTDLVTKMYVNTIETKQSSTGLLTIMDNPVNPTGEDYLLNFDYLYAIGTITDEQYAYIKEFSKEMRTINNSILSWQEKAIKRYTVQNTYSAEQQVLETAILEDSEQIGTYSDYRTELQNEGIISRSGTTGLELFVTSGVITFTDVGVLANTIKIYTDDKKTTKIKTGKIKLDSSLPKYAVSVSGLSKYSSVFVEYNYFPAAYYDSVIILYEKRLDRDQTRYDTLAAKIEELNNDLNTEEEKIETLSARKTALLSKFERIMGPALREGNWTPEDYSNVANANYQFKTKLIMEQPADTWSSSYKTIFEASNGPLTKLRWDSNLNYNEATIRYKNIQDTYSYYYIFELTTAHLNEMAKFYADSNNDGVAFGLVWWDSGYANHVDRASPVVKMIPIGSECECVFLCKTITEDNIEKKVIVPALVLTDLEETELTNFKTSTTTSGTSVNNTLYFCGITAEYDEDEDKFVVKRTGAKTKSGYYQLDIDNAIVKANSNYTVHQLRCHIGDYTLLTDENNLKVSYGGKLLTEFNDYSVEQAVHTSSVNLSDKGYDITFKPASLFKLWNANKYIQINYSCSQLATSVYLDAVKILKENAYPKVTYSIDPNLIYKEFFKTDYKALNKIAFINDNELEFNQVQGYISSINLNLDKPWEDSIEVKNYKNKFEDIFSTIVAQTESMEKNEAIITSVGNTINYDGTISSETLASTLATITLKYSINGGILSLNKANGLLLSSSAGAINLKPTNISIATTVTGTGDWAWNKIITPSGINAAGITYGTLALDKVLISGSSTNGALTINGSEILSAKQYKTEENQVITSVTDYYLSINEGRLRSKTLRIENGSLISEKVVQITQNEQIIDQVISNLSITDGILESGALSLDNGTLTLVDDHDSNNIYNAVQLIPAASNTYAKLYINNKYNLFINNQNIQSYIESIAETFMTGSWNGYTRYIPIANTDVGRSSSSRSVHLTTQKLRLGIVDVRSLLYYEFNENTHVAKLSLGTVSTPVILNEVTYDSFNSTWTNNKFTIAGWDADAGTLGLYTKDQQNNIISQILPSKLKINNYLETFSDSAGANVKLSRLYLTRPTLGANQSHIITFCNDDLQDTPDYKLKINDEGLFISLDGGTTYLKILIEQPEEPEPTPEEP